MIHHIKMFVCEDVLIEIEKLLKELYLIHVKNKKQNKGNYFPLFC